MVAGMPGQLEVKKHGAANKEAEENDDQDDDSDVKQIDALFEMVNIIDHENVGGVYVDLFMVAGVQYVMGDGRFFGHTLNPQLRGPQHLCMHKH
jgi:hypothetical protein